MLIIVALALPLAGLLLLLIRPDLDLQWQHNPTHFWLVIVVSVLAVLLGLVMGEAARKRRDVRVFLVSLAFTSSAGFLALHALATPGVLLAGPNAGFDVAMPLGLFVGSCFAAASSLPLLSPAARWLGRSQQLLRSGVLGLLLAWAVISLAGWPPLGDPDLVEAGEGWLIALGIAGMILYGIAALRYVGIYRRRSVSLVLAIVATWVLLGEAMLAVTVSSNWHLSWWEWHVLMAVAFLVAALAVRKEYRRQDSVPAAFSSLYLDSTLGRVDRERADAVKALLSHDAGIEDLSARFELSGDEAELLAHAAREIRKLDELFAPYLSTQLAARIRRNPELTELGGDTRDITVLFADLRGFTAFSEESEPGQVVEMLNEYWSLTLPVVEANGGFVDSIAGDAVLVVFNVTGDQDDHALRGCRAGLGFQEGSEEVAGRHLGWPRFRIGVNTGPAVVGNVGSEERRSFTAIGDTVNVASRLQAQALPGEVLIGETTYEAARDRLTVESVGLMDLSGRANRVEVFRLREVHD
ncbi:MAG TPA: adenylate/guanylate cyclase domain-containing protein [Acidimicrobiia bacterium]|nr:adenylate/guanylate cyclase domain-containing protein [Acidimicrobiia bacterium]